MKIIQYLDRAVVATTYSENKTDSNLGVFFPYIFRSEAAKRLFPLKFFFQKFSKYETNQLSGFFPINKKGK